MRTGHTDLDGQQATIYFTSKKAKRHFLTTVQGSRVLFKIPKVLPVESYLVEVVAADMYSSDQNPRWRGFNPRTSTSEQVLRS